MINFVTHNMNKFNEVSKIMEDNNININLIKLEYEEIQADTTEKISYDSCKKLINKVNSPYFIDDTGLYIDELKGFPGPYASYVQSTIGNKNIIKLAANSKAYFKTVISFYYKNEIYQFTGILNGKISNEEKGDNKFGYDPVFMPENYNKTLAELSIDEKNKISHRSIAMNNFISFLIENNIK